MAESTKSVKPSESPESEAQKKEKSDRAIRANEKAKELLMGYIKTFKCLLIIGLAFNLLGMVGEFASPLFIGWVIDAIVDSDFDRVTELIIWWMIINTSGAIFGGFQRYVFQVTTEKIGQALRQDVFDEIVHKDVAFFDSRKTGDLSKYSLQFLTTY